MVKEKVKSCLPARPHVPPLPAGFAGCPRFAVGEPGEWILDGWLEYEKMCAGNWRPNNGQHSPRHDFTVEIKDTEHPITRGMKSSFLQPNDELYSNLRWQPEGSYHVLATAWDDHARYGDKAAQPTPGPGRHHPVLWTVRCGKGRVFGDVLGHDAAAMQSPGFIATFVRGTEWAATGEVTLPLPAELSR